VTVSVLNNDKDANGDVLSVTALTQPTNGTAVLNSNGTVTYTPKTGFAGTDKFTYKASDGLAQSTAATVTVTVVNRAPVAGNDTVSTSKSVAVIIPVLTNDSDPDGDTLSVTGLVQPANGSVVVGANGNLTYTPKSGFVGTDTFTYKATDGSATSNVATVTVQVTPGANMAPVAANDSSMTTKGVPVIISVLANDTDANGDWLTPQLVTAPSSGTAVVNSDGTVTYTPLGTFVGTDTFTYWASDGTLLSNIATVTVQVKAPNTAPVGVADAASTYRNTAVKINLTANDTDAEKDPLTATNLTAPTNGTVVLNSDGTVTYTPKTGYVGTDSFTYKAFDGSAYSTATTVTVQVANRPPVAVNDIVASPKGAAISISVLANDSDPDGDVLTVTALTQPANGTIVLNSNGTITYTPKKGFSGIDSFTYQASDGLAQSNTATVSISVRAGG
jgi:VCBS repeat-containing protein